MKTKEYQDRTEGKKWPQYVKRHVFWSSMHFVLCFIPNVLWVCYERQREKMILNTPLSFNYFLPLSGLEVLPWGQR